MCCLSPAPVRAQDVAFCTLHFRIEIGHIHNEFCCLTLQAGIAVVAGFFASSAIDGLQKVPDGHGWQVAFVFAARSCTLASSLGILILLAAAGLHQQGLVRSVALRVSMRQRMWWYLRCCITSQAVSNKDRPEKLALSEDSAEVQKKQRHAKLDVFKRFKVLLSILLLILIFSGFAASMAHAFLSYVQRPSPILEVAMTPSQSAVDFPDEPNGDSGPRVSYTTFYSTLFVTLFVCLVLPLLLWGYYVDGFGPRA
jgi:hypothetical protein